jgi:hypothetical protein
MKRRKKEKKNRVMSVDVNHPDFHLAFILATWPHLAPYAYDKYLEYGKGAVEIDLAQKIVVSITEDNKLATIYEPNYIVESDEKLQSPIARKIIADYNPEKSVAYLMIANQPAPDGYRDAALMVKTNTPPPKELYESSQSVN